ncbi:MAG: hypothetical protein QF921_07945 [Pseudomonadales bacterium]|jgi:hypothetical protein|nr:hypothetical protein [Pseudomonadales bacterium]MDP6471738.1 hypothetical protein [Pseudomonadales bacterium]MDP6971430.1 hypothetical protein [Pseudomonadales bacterium]|tara:strand:+ start:696 stop:869 length:174 start_codon:yes stop_codon:yes gene_type:complete
MMVSLVMAGAQSRAYQVQDFDRIYFSGTGTLNVVQDSTSQGTVRAQGAEAVLSHLAV